MDPGRYMLQQGWDPNSALEGYGGLNEPEYRLGGSYGGRRLTNDGFPRGGIHRDLPDNDVYPPSAPVTGIWPESRRRNFDDDHSIRESRRNDRPYIDSLYEMDNYRDLDKYRDSYRNSNGYNDVDDYNDYGFGHTSRPGDYDGSNNEYYEYRHRGSRRSRENVHETDHALRHHSYDSDYDKGKRDSSWRRRDSRDRGKRFTSPDRDVSPHGRWEPSRSRSRSRGRDGKSRSRSRGRSRGRSHREESYDDGQYERSEKRRNRDYENNRLTDSSSVAPSATVVVKGLSQKTTEEDLYQILAEWGPLHHVRVIRERNSAVSRGFAFIDFPTVGAARKMMDVVGDDGFVFDGRKIFFEYSSKPTSGVGATGFESNLRSGHFRGNTQSDWICPICGCLNFARRTSCFQCNEPRSEDALLADLATVAHTGKKGSDSGPTHVLVVRGLDENADEDMLRYEFSKHAPIKDIRLVRDKFTHVSRGFAFAHFHSVDDATKALEATNGIKLEKNGQVLRVAYAKSTHGPGASGASQASSLAAAAIEAAAFSQQYDTAGWAPKEYNLDEQPKSGFDQNGNMDTQKGNSAPQSGFVWDEASGYYYDASSGFYYDGNTGLYYDSKSGMWFSYDHQNQQYVPCTDQTDNKASENPANQSAKSSDDTSKRKVVISAPAATVTKDKPSLPDAVQAAAAAALAAEKKEKEKQKELKLASKSSILANKKKMNNVLTMWKQRNHDGQATRVLDDGLVSGSMDDKASASSNSSAGLNYKNKYKFDSTVSKEGTKGGSGFSASGVGRGMVNNSMPVSSPMTGESQNIPRSAGIITGVIRSSGRGIVKSGTIYSGSVNGNDLNFSTTEATISGTSSVTAGATPVGTPFKTDASALGAYATPTASSGGKRRFSEAPIQSMSREQPHATYRDRAAERRSLYGSSAKGDDTLDLGFGDSNRDISYRKGSSDIGAMPFPPGVGGGHIANDAQSYEVVPSDRAIDENNVGNRMLRNMGWQEGSGLGKDGSGITEPVQANGKEDRAGLGRYQRKVDPDLEVQAGDSYRTLIQKKAIARFREMS